MTSLLWYTGRMAKWCIVLGTSDTMCMACAPIKGHILANLVAGLAGPLLEEGVATQSDSRGLRVETSSRRCILTPSDLLEWLNGALAMMDPWMSYFRGIVTHYRVSKC